MSNTPEPEHPANVPPPLPADPHDFYNTAGEAALPRQSPDLPPAMETLGPAPFPKGKFPFLGFLASVYEHIATHAKQRASRGTDAP